jgi:hypothetical protein
LAATDKQRQRFRATIRNMADANQPDEAAAIVIKANSEWVNEFILSQTGRDTPAPEPVAPSPSLTPEQTAALVDDLINEDREEFEAGVYKIIAEKTGLNYREFFRVAMTDKDQELRAAINNGDCATLSPAEVADIVIEDSSEAVAAHLQSLTTLPAHTDDDEGDPRVGVINQIVFEKTGLNYLEFFTDREIDQFVEILHDDAQKGVAPAITAGKVIERFKGYVLAHFMSLTGIAPGMTVR